MLWPNICLETKANFESELEELLTISFVQSVSMSFNSLSSPCNQFRCHSKECWMLPRLPISWDVEHITVRNHRSKEDFHWSFGGVPWDIPREFPSLLSHIIRTVFKTQWSRTHVKCVNVTVGLGFYTNSQTHCACMRYPPFRWNFADLCFTWIWINFVWERKRIWCGR